MFFTPYLSPLINLYMNNFASPVHLAATVGYYAGAYYLSKKAMPYLRGSKYGKAPLAFAKPASLAGKVKKLERRVARQSPEIRYWPYDIDILNATTIGTTDIAFSTLFTADTDFRDNVSGDKWRNLALRLAFGAETVALDRVRIIIYKSNRVASFLPTALNTALDFTRHYEPNDFTFYHDSTYNSAFDTHLNLSRNIKLGFDSTFDDINVTKGLLRIRITMEMNALVGARHARLSTNLVFQDK